MTSIDPRLGETRGVVRATEFISTGRVKGTMLSAHVQWVREHRSAAEYVRLWDSLPREVRMSIGMVLPVKWYEFAHLMALDHAIVDLFGSGSKSLLRDLGAYSARVNLTGAYKAYDRPGVHDFFASSARLHSQFQDFGDASYATRSANSGVMTHRNYSSYSPLYCESAAGYYQESVVLHGGKDVTVNEAECQCRGDGACVFVMRWS
jgi:hypothetical protein